VKRLVDLVLGTVALAATAPLWLVFAAAIKLTDRGPVFFCQERVGKDGRSFQIRKFRSMRSMSPAGDVFLQTPPSDPRVTPIGRFLRATALDELPQLLNILRGEMSFVGPRALAPNEIEIDGNGEAVSLSAEPGFEARHCVRPGLTGLAQVYATRTLPRRHKFKFDLLYIKKQTLWLDLKLIGISIARTLDGGWEAQHSRRVRHGWAPSRWIRRSGADRREALASRPVHERRVRERRALRPVRQRRASS
jgi:lipopolysaccharide/colanic/teichoic acid biosynthesis glycosyltransferase